MLFLYNCQSESEKDKLPYSNIDSIDEFGIYLLDDTIQYEDVIADTSKINVNPEPFIFIDDIDYYELASQSMVLKDSMDFIGLGNRPYILISNGQILSIGTFYFSPNCCWAISNNKLFIREFYKKINRVPVSKDQREIFQRNLPPNKLRKEIITNMRNITKVTEDSLKIDIEFINNTQDSIYMLDPSKTPDFYSKGHDGDIIIGEYDHTENSKQAALPRDFTNENYTLVLPDDTITISLDQRALSYVSSTPLQVGQTYNIRLYYNNSSDVASLKAIWQSIIVHSQSIEIK